MRSFLRNTVALSLVLVILGCTAVDLRFSPADSGTGSLSNGKACSLSRRLRGGSSCPFLIGLGNDLIADGEADAYNLPTRVDLHYAFLAGTDWPNWQPNGGYVDMLADDASRAGMIPMFTLSVFNMVEDPDFTLLTNPTQMDLYWANAKLLFQRLAAFNRPAIVHIEPAFWDHAVQLSPDAALRVLVSTHAPDCADLSDDLAGMVGCLVRLARSYSPKVAVGLHASEWGAKEAPMVRFFRAVRAETMDFLAIDVAISDAGCVEARACPGSNSIYWDETNTTSPNFHDHLGWAKTIHDGLSLPILWWQLPLGVPSSTPGGTPRHYRDNRVHYLFHHIDEFAAAGGVGAAFGVGSDNQTDVTTDGGQFSDSVRLHNSKPFALEE